MSAIRLACVCLALIYGGITLTVGGDLLQTARAEAGKKGGKKPHKAKKHGKTAKRHAKKRPHKAKRHSTRRNHAKHRRQRALRAHHHRHPHWHHRHPVVVRHRVDIDRNVHVNKTSNVNVNRNSSATIIGGVGFPRIVGPRIRVGYLSVLGKITAVNGNAVTVAPANGAAVTVHSTSETLILVNSQAAKVADLRQGDRAKASFDPNRNALSLAVVRD